MPLRPGGIKTYSNDYNNFTCCHGTGHGEQHQVRRQHLLPRRRTRCTSTCSSPRVLTWAARGHHRPAGHHVPGGGVDPADHHRVRARIDAAGSASRPGRPGAQRPGQRRRRSGRHARRAPTPTINRTWAAGDVVDVGAADGADAASPPRTTRHVQAVKYGPIVLAGAYGTNNLTRAADAEPPPSIAADRDAAAVHRDRRAPAR